MNNLTDIASENQRQLARLPPPALTNGVPEKLAAARLRRQAEVAQGVSNVTVTVVAGGRD